MDLYAAWAMPAISAASLNEHLTTLIWLLVFAWLFWFGGSVGSFMNVVVYRLPAGLNLVHPGSRCPKCLHPIRWYHNLPILGWLMLRGRCRDCSAPISARYPLVEAMVASLFIALAAVLVLGIGQARRAFVDVPELVWGTYAFQLALACTLICAALMEFDGQLSPARLFAPAAAVGLIAPLFWPDLRPIPISPGFIPVANWFQGLADGVGGYGVGSLLGIMVAAAASGKSASYYKWFGTVVLPPTLCGIFLGWQAAQAIVTLAAILWLLSATTAHVVAPLRRCGWSVCVAAAAVVVLFALPAVSPFVPGLVSSAGLALLIASCAIIPLASVIASRLMPPYIEKTSASQGEDPVTSPQENLQVILQSSTYRLAESDVEFLARPELRPVRMQLELLKPQLAFEDLGILSTVVVFGGTSIVERHVAEERLEHARNDVAQAPDAPAAKRALLRAERVVAKAHYYDEARAFGRLVSSSCQPGGPCDYVVITGGGPGIMEAANRGAFDIGAKSIGLNITLPAEQAPNPYITPELCFQFHYFALRKMHFLMRAKALVVFPGGFGTLDELTDALTLRQTERMQAIPIIMYGREYWERVIDFQFLADEGVIADEHLNLIDYADTPEEAWRIIATYHKHDA